MTVLQFSTLVPPAHFGGAERVVRSLTEDLEEAGLTVHNAGLGPRGVDDRLSTSAIANLYWPFDGARRSVISRSAWHLVDAVLLLARSRVVELFDQTRPTVIVTHNLRGWGLAPWVVAKERGVPVVQVVHDYGLICNPATLWKGQPCEGLCSPCRVRARATTARWPGGRLIGVSQAVLDAQQRYVDLGPAAGVAHPLRAATPVTRSLRRRDGGTRALGFVGRLAPAKGLELLLEVVRDSDHQLLVAGTGDETYLAELRALAPPNVTWLGWVEPDELFGQIDALVVPSAWPEPFGLVVVEAAAADVPVLIADHPGLVEAAQASGARFATFLANDVTSLRAALERGLEAYEREADPIDPLDLVALVVGLATAPTSAGPADSASGDEDHA